MWCACRGSGLTLIQIEGTVCLGRFNIAYTMLVEQQPDTQIYWWSPFSYCLVPFLDSHVFVTVQTHRVPEGSWKEAIGFPAVELEACVCVFLCVQYFFTRIIMFSVFSEKYLTCSKPTMSRKVPVLVVLLKWKAT